MSADLPDPGFLSVTLAQDLTRAPEGCNIFEDHVVILDDGDTYSGVNGAMVWLDGKGYPISELLNFTLIFQYFVRMHFPKR